MSTSRTTPTQAGSWPMIGPPTTAAREPSGYGPPAGADVTGNRLLAARARDMADRAMTQRKAWLSVAVALDTTRSLTAARAALDDVSHPVRDLACQFLHQLTEGDQQL